jgi:hypothetical protein
LTPRQRFFVAALLIWPLFLVVAVTLGLFRERFIAPLWGEQAAHVIGTCLFIGCLLVLIGAFVHRFYAASRSNASKETSSPEETSRSKENRVPGDLWRVGLMWTVMTVCFEFGFFHFVAGVPWAKLLADYNLLAGRLWVLVLLTTLVGPTLVYRWQRSREA